MKDNNNSSYKILTSPSYGEYEEKKSKFLAYMDYASTEEEALAFIASIKKKHYDARHNCSAFIVGENGEISRSSDDGEPSGTAGKPMLEIISQAGLNNIVVVVTRYFGGVLLGTGGLVRAYSQAVKDALNNATLATMTYSSDIKVSLSYSDSNNLLYYIRTNNICLVDSLYTDSVSLVIRAENSLTEDIISKITELTQGKSQIEIISSGFNPINT